MKRFIKILNWCKEHPLEKGRDYEINAYVFEKLFGIGPVSLVDIACCYKLLGYDVKKTRNIYGPCWKIST